MDIQKEKKAIKGLKSLYMEMWDLTEDQKDEFDSLVSRVFSFGKQQAQKVAVPETNISFEDWISDHKNDYVHFGGYQERAHELANRAWNASANTLIPKDKVLMPKKLSTKHIDYVVKELAISGGVSLIEEVYQCLIEAQEQVG